MLPCSWRWFLSALVLQFLTACELPTEGDSFTGRSLMMDSGNSDGDAQSDKRLIAAGDIANNLLKNPSGGSGNLSGWTILNPEDEGEGWLVVDNAFFVTSYKWARRTQTVDLYEHGLTAKRISGSMGIEVSEEFGKTYCPDEYYLKVQLLDGDNQVVSTFSTGEVKQSGLCEYNLNWKTVSYTFSGYGSDVRYVRWEDGGKDSEQWGGHYGAAMKNAVLRVHTDDSEPETVIDTASAPPVVTSLTSARFSFSSSEEGSSFECSLDGALFTDCSSNQVYSSLPEGEHVFQVRAVDKSGNSDSTPDKYRWTVDRSPPEPPVFQVPRPNQQFLIPQPVFSGTADSNSTVHVFIDGVQVGGDISVNEIGYWELSSPILRWETHRITATATDPAGNTSGTSPEVAFSIAQSSHYGYGCAEAPSAVSFWPLVVLGGLRRRRAG